MVSWPSLALAALLQATAVSSAVSGKPRWLSKNYCQNSSSSPEHEFLQVHQSLMMSEKNQQVPSQSLNVPIHAHVILDSSEKGDNITLNRIHSDIKYLNKAYETSRVSFSLLSSSWIDLPPWANGFQNDIKPFLYRAGPATLHLNYWTTVKWNDSTAEGASSYPFSLEMPGEAEFDSVDVPKKFKFGHLLAHEIGHWFGLLHSYDELCNYEGPDVCDAAKSSSPMTRRDVQDTTRSYGDYICDTDAPPPKEQGAEAKEFPADNFMSYSPTASRFTPGQSLRMRNLWARYRGKDKTAHVKPARPKDLRRIEPVTGKGKLPYYPDPKNKFLVFQKCNVKLDGSIDEQREEYCGTEAFCRFRLYKLDPRGTAYSRPDRCLDDRKSEASSKLPWREPRSGVDTGVWWLSELVSERDYGTKIFCGAIDNHRPYQKLVNAEGRVEMDMYASSDECFEDHENAP